ncbi:TPA: chitinase [Serratia odorifera]|nr:chitinase [Serratia odorifera]
MKKLLKLTTLTTCLMLAGVSALSHASVQDAASAMPDISTKKIMVGFWHNWASKSDGYQRGTSAEFPLSQVPEGYNVVTVAFMTGDGIPTFKPYNMSDAEFRAEVGKLNAQGRAVLLSLGGADAHIALKTGDAKQFANEIIKLIDMYGFDGLDIDLEGSAITAGANATEIPAALKMVKQQYPKFIISMAPEFPHLRKNAGYETLVKSLEGYYDFISPQYYNQAGDGVDVPGVGYLAQNNEARKAEFLFYLTDSFIHGTRGYIQIPAEKLVIGLPSNPDAAGSGYVKKEADLRSALEKLAAQGTPIKGLMTWSVNWDAGRDANGNAYGYEFVNRYTGLVHDDIPAAPDTEAPSRPGKPIGLASDETISLTWTASQDNQGVDHYEIWRDGSKVAHAIVPEWKDKNIKPATTYGYYVIAVDKAGNHSEASATTLVTSAADNNQPEQDIQLPSTPQGIQASHISQTSVTLNWQAATDNVGVIHYQIWRNGIAVATSKVTNWSDNNLKAGNQYAYQIVAVDAAGNNSAKSQTLMVKTLSEPGNDGDHGQGTNTFIPGKAYVKGDKVIYNGKVYRCINAHTAAAHWAPDVAHSLWLPDGENAPGGDSDHNPGNDGEQLPDNGGDQTPDNDGEHAITGFTTGKNYHKGDRVHYNGKVYRCINPHTSAAHWAPDVALSLWAQEK